MFPNQPVDKFTTTADQASQSVDHLVNATQRVSDMAHRGMDSVREKSHQLRVKADLASEKTVNYIRQEPVKSVLIAAATGAALVALGKLISRSRDRN